MAELARSGEKIRVYRDRTEYKQEKGTERSEHDRLAPFVYPRGFETRRVNTSGDISWHEDRVFISQVFSLEDLGFEEMDEDIFKVYFREIELDVTELRFRPVRALP